MNHKFFVIPRMYSGGQSEVDSHEYDYGIASFYFENIWNRRKTACE